MKSEGSVYVLGSINIDLSLSISRMPKVGETMLGDDLYQNVGGKGFNQAHSSAALSLDTYLIGAVGNDQFGMHALKVIKKKGINVSNVVTKDVTSGLAFIIRSNNDNTILLHGGANLRLDETQIVLSNAKENDIFITQLEVRSDVVEYGLRLAKEKKMITIFNPSPAVILTKDIYQLVDYIVINQTECEILTGIYPASDEKIMNAAQLLIKLGVKNVIITLGAKGCAYYNGNHFIKQKSLATKVVDTTGAGDSFIGGLAYGILHQFTIAKTLKLASLTAGYTCGIKGVENAMPNINQINLKELI